ncbi:translation initiation factor IF-2 N-terminal domain-containing protein, partial [Anaerospora sp.]|uniref:translation initiation factor IF-2 N-terminal domain-containing protein n=1 Tax=Anaerospora sp. TaxID=1960278 RepID=UPI00289FC104
MSKHRIYELAKDYSTTSKVIIDILSRNSITAKNHMSSVDDDAKVVLERTFARKTGNEDQSGKAPKAAAPDVAEKVNKPSQPSTDHTAANNNNQAPRPPYQQQGQQGMNQQRPMQPQGQNNNRPPYQQQGQQGMNQQRPMQPQGQNNFNNN